MGRLYLDNFKLKNMKVYFIFVVLLLTATAQGQLLSIGAKGLTIKSGTPLVAEKLTLIPFADITITNNTLNKHTSIENPGTNPHISRVYRFSNTTPAFNGSVQINYQDGAELNGIGENALSLHIHNGTAWAAYPATTRDGINNFVFTNNISNVALKELTLKFSSSSEAFSIIGNPVTNNLLTVLVNIPNKLALYTIDGKLLWQENVNAGTKTFNMSRYAKGTYLLRANNKTKKVVLQ